MNIEHINAKNVNNRLKTEIKINDIRELINNKKILIISNCFDTIFIDKILDKVHDIGIQTSEKNLQNSAKVNFFHRIDNNHPKMHVQRIAHFFRFSYFDKKIPEIFDLFEPLNVLRNKIAEIDENYSYFDDVNGFISQPAVLHYPSGGGYMQEHVDPVDPQKVEMVLSGSERGIDFEDGGLEIFINGKWIDVENYIKKGDIVMFKPDIPHRVMPINSNSDLDWNNRRGRWTIFSPIAHSIKKELNEKKN